MNSLTLNHTNTNVANKLISVKYEIKANARILPTMQKSVNCGQPVGSG